jgi:hypothetical protein
VVTGCATWKVRETDRPLLAEVTDAVDAC